MPEVGRRKSEKRQVSGGTASLQQFRAVPPQVSGHVADAPNGAASGFSWGLSGTVVGHTHHDCSTIAN
jgi:hypothetical protein